MTRTIQTALLLFPDLIACSPSAVPVQIWPDMREAHDAICNVGVSRAEIAAKFPQFDFAECSAEWDYPPHTIKGAEMRAERIRERLRKLPAHYKNIALVTHRGIIAFLVMGERFDVCGKSSFSFLAPVNPVANSHQKRVAIDSQVRISWGAIGTG
jgi:broad specificity phosphatase PhoE